MYRVAGVNSRVQKLLGLAMGTHTHTQHVQIVEGENGADGFSAVAFPSSDPKTCADVELENHEWEIKTITSAIKHYLR